MKDNNTASENNTADNSSKDTSGNSFKSLYKFTNMDFIESCILNGVYGSHLDKVNDPFEGKGINNPELYRICCLTNSPKQMLLWAYYGNHKECCIEYDVSDIDNSLLKRVNYINTFIDHEDMTLFQIYESLYSKGREWKHENEIRAVYYKKNFDRNLWIVDGSQIFLKAKVKSVIFGLLSEQDVERYGKALLVLKKYGIDAKKCKLKKGEYKLVYDNQFDSEIELERIKEILNQNVKRLSEQTSTEVISEDFDKEYSLDENEQKVLRIIAELQNTPRDIISKDRISSINLEGVQIIIRKLMAKGMIENFLDNENGKSKTYYTITSLGEKYIL